MASVIRLLPRKRIERNVVPYVALLDVVMWKRFCQAARTVSYIVGLAVLLTIVFAKQAVSLQRTLFLFVSAGIYLTMLKFMFHSESRVYPSAIAEFWGNLCSFRTYFSVVFYVVSALFYLKSILVPDLAFYTVRRAEPIKLPEGIPPSLALHRTDQWFVINEKCSYLVTFAITFAVAHAIAFIVRDSGLLRLEPAENGKKPFFRIKRRLGRGFAPALVSWALAATLFPIFYVTFVRRWLVKAGTVFIAKGSASAVVDMSGLRIVYLLLPAFALPLAMLWYMALEVFMAYLSLGPLFRGKPISEAATSDKNGSLVDGLSRNPGALTGLTAWHELLLIAEHEPIRRRNIFNDVDGERVIWEQVHREFQKLIEKHVKNLSPKKPAPEKKNPESEKFVEKTHRNVINSFSPNATTSTAAIIETTIPKPSAFGSNDPQIQVTLPGTNSKLFKQESAFEKKLAMVTRKLESKSTTRAQRVRAHILRMARKATSGINIVYEKFLGTRIGTLFRRTVSRSLAARIQHPQTTAFALRSIARMITKSIAEDEYGYVQGTIAGTLASLDTFAEKLEHSISQPQIDRSDVLVKRGLAKPDTSRAVLMAGEVNGAFAEILEIYEPFLENLGVSHAVRRRAQKLAAGDLIVAKTAWLSE